MMIIQITHASFYHFILFHSISFLFKIYSKRKYTQDPHPRLLYLNISNRQYIMTSDL